MKTLLKLMLSILLFTVSLHAAHADGKMTLVDPKKPVPKIVISATATEAEKYAAAEMQTYLGKLTGRVFTVIDDQIIPTGVIISIGQNKLSVSYHPEKLGVEEYIMDVKPNLLLIVGGRKPSNEDTNPERGTLYGVYDFLDSLGVRWYRPESWGEYVPSINKVSVKSGKTQKKPYFNYRAGLSGYRPYETPDQRVTGVPWCVRNRLNGGNFEAKFGGGVAPLGSHSYQRLIPNSMYYPTHPEYFALINGQRSNNESAQLCLSNKDLKTEFAIRVIAAANSSPSMSIVSIEPNDGHLWCECADCKAMDDPNLIAGHNGKVSMSNRVYAFSNIIANKVKAQRPDIKLSLLAYSTHTEVPTLVSELEPSIVIRATAYDGGYSDYSRDLRDTASKQNAAFLKVIEGFSKLGAELTTYEYYTGYAWWGPMPVVHVLKDRLKEYLKLGLKGSSTQANPIHWGPQGINMYMFTKLLWNPYLDVDKELDLYYKNYYGPAEKPMKAYHEYLENIAYKGKYWGSGGYQFWDLIGKAELAQMKTYMDQAKALVAGKPIYEKRLEGVWAGYEITRRIREMQWLETTGKIAESKAMANSILDFIESYPTEWVFQCSTRADMDKHSDVFFNSLMDHYLNLK
ncbi:MAG: DUF4838 domain-containing protein [Prolixibacteraceae bacterium]|jgi:hypothetical protein|nr:DUF4838 domain-containing protein [Prolixibacteraceae bacterium]